MAGIYLHIPYCKVKCHYCDFYFSTNHQNKQNLLQALRADLQKNAELLGDQQIATIYFGGGTPSLLEEQELQDLLSTIHENFDVDPTAEVTLECNPDDLDPAKLRSLKNAGINRLSIGVQSFQDEVLSFMNRAHDASESLSSIKDAQDAGFDNITIDLIYGVPEKDINYWEDQIDTFLKLNIPHLSAYCLTIEPQTVFGHRHKKGELKVIEDEATLAQFELLMAKTAADYDHYETSNFAKEGYISKHNSAYWKGAYYLGVGPSAHSFFGDVRSWNIANNNEYIRRVAAGEKYSENEQLTSRDQFNDLILTSLRTKWGISEKKIRLFEQELDLKDFHLAKQKHLDQGNLNISDDKIYLTDQAKFIVDAITADLFV